MIWSTEAHNLVPNEGLNAALATLVTGGPQTLQWFIGIYEGNYTPTATVTAATIAALATECVAYAAATRPQAVYGPVSAQSTSNSASVAEFTMNATKTIYGGFVVSSSVKGGTAGSLLSVVRAPVSKVFESGDIVRVTVTLGAISA